MIHGMINMKATLASVLHSLVDFDVFRIVKRVGHNHVLHLCVCLD
jgi:hypothetical protein